MHDELDHVRATRPDVDPPSLAFVHTERQRLMAHITQTASRPTTPGPVGGVPNRDEGRRNRRFWLAPALTFGLLATAAAGWAMTRPVEDSTEVSCGMTNVIDSVTGDPVADCADWWRATNQSEPPALVAYDTGTGGVTVLPESETAPSGWTRLDSFRQDATLIELDAALGDVGDGLAADCYRNAEAEPIVRDTLMRLGLDDWSVVQDGELADGTSTCSQHVLQPQEHQVTIVGLPGDRPPADAPPARLASAVQDDVDDRCLGLDDAVAAVRRAAAEIGLVESPGALVIHSLVDPEAACSRTDVNVGGSIEVTVRGS